MAAKHLSSSDNPVIKRFRRVAAGHRDEAFLLEGRHLLDEALAASWPLEAILIEEGLWEDWRRRLEAWEGEGKVFVVPRKLVQAAGTTASPEGVLALARRRPASWPALDPGGLYLFLDGVQDPANVGILLRSARAFGLAGAFAGTGTADPFHPTALARSAGAVLRAPTMACSTDSFLEWCSSCGVALFAAEPGGPLPDAGAPVSRPAALAVGNEGRGLSDAVLSGAARRVGIPMAPGWDSLNVAVAGSLLMAVLSGLLMGENP